MGQIYKRYISIYVKKNTLGRGELEEIWHKKVQFKQLDLLQDYNIINIKT